MFTGIRRRSRRLASRASSLGRAKPDPKLQLEQAIAEAQKQHGRLLEQAATATIARQQALTELELILEELEKVSGHTKQAVLMADESAQRGNEAKVAEFTSAAESFAGRLVAGERRRGDLEQRALQCARDADQANLAARETATALQQTLEERQRLLSPGDQAAQQKRMRTVMASLSAPTGDDGPTESELLDTIETYHAQTRVESHHADPNPQESPSGPAGDTPKGEARARLAQIRAQLELEPIEGDELGATTEPAVTPAPGQVERA